MPIVQYYLYAAIAGLLIGGLCGAIQLMFERKEYELASKARQASINRPLQGQP